MLPFTQSELKNFYDQIDNNLIQRPSRCSYCGCRLRVNQTLQSHKKQCLAYIQFQENDRRQVQAERDRATAIAMQIKQCKQHLAQQNIRVADCMNKILFDAQAQKQLEQESRRRLHYELQLEKIRQLQNKQQLRQFQRQKLNCHKQKFYNSDKICSICAEPIDYEQSMEVCQYFHIFHIACIRQLVRRRIDRCPMCRESFNLPKDMLDE